MTEEETNQKSMDRSVPKARDDYIQKREKPEKGNKHGNDSNSKEDNGFTLFVTNLSSRITKKKLKDAFQSYGHIDHCYVIFNPITGESRKFGFVTFKVKKDAQKAMVAMNHQYVEGKSIRIEVAKRNRPHDPTPGHYMGVKVLARRNGKFGYRKPYGYENDRKRSEPRRYNPYYDDSYKGFNRNHVRSYADKYYRSKYGNDCREYNRKPYSSRSLDRKLTYRRSIDKRSVDRKISKRSIDKRSIDRRSYGKRSIDRRSYGKRSIDRRSYGKRSIDRRSYGKRSIDRKSSEKKTYTKKRTYKKSIDKYSNDSYDRYHRKGNGYKKTKYSSKVENYDHASYDKYDKNRSKYSRSRRSVSRSIDDRKYRRSYMSNNRSPYSRK